MRRERELGEMNQNARVGGNECGIGGGEGLKRGGGGGVRRYKKEGGEGGGGGGGGGEKKRGGGGGGEGVWSMYGDGV